jgi:iron complex transport system substrate-binding protein
VVEKEDAKYAEQFFFDENTGNIMLFDHSGNTTALRCDTAGDRLVCLSSTHIAFLAAIGEEDHIIGAPDSAYIFNSDIKAKMRSGETAIVASGAALNEERILELAPTAIFTDYMRASEMTLFEAQGIPVIYIEEFRENSPLARAEWIKVFGYVTGKKLLADSIFNKIDEDYNRLKTNVEENVVTRPTIFGGTEYQGVWYVSGGESYIARLYQDAGTEYVFADNKHTSSIPMDFEAVYEKGMDCDFWRIVFASSTMVTYNMLEGFNAHYADFNAFKNKSVILCNPSESAYFEKGVIEPHIILADLVYAVHPELIPEHKPVYYRILN